MKQQQQHTHHQQYSRISKIEVNGTAVQKKSGDACRVFYRFLVGYFFSLLLYLLSEYLLLASLSLQILFLFIYLSCVCVCFFVREFWFLQIFRVILLECHCRYVLLLSFKFSLSLFSTFGCVRVWPLCRNFIHILFNTNAECHYDSHSFITLTFLMYNNIQYIEYSIDIDTQYK